MKPIKLIGIAFVFIGILTGYIGMALCEISQPPQGTLDICTNAPITVSQVGYEAKTDTFVITYMADGAVGRLALGSDHVLEQINLSKPELRIGEKGQLIAIIPSRLESTGPQLLLITGPNPYESIEARRLQNVKLIGWSLFIIVAGLAMLSFYTIKRPTLQRIG
jgi:hypothetical protein